MDLDVDPRITYDRECDALYIHFREGRVWRSAASEDATTIIDLDVFGQVVGLEVLDAAQRIGAAVAGPDGDAAATTEAWIAAELHADRTGFEGLLSTAAARAHAVVDSDGDRALVADAFTHVRAQQPAPR